MRVWHELAALQIPEKDLDESLVRLRAAFADPQHYGDNKPGSFFNSGIPTTPDPRFSFLDFYGFGASGEGGFEEFSNLVGLPQQITDETAYVLIALLLIDSSVEKLEQGDFELASSDAMEAADIFSDYILGVGVQERINRERGEFARAGAQASHRKSLEKRTQLLAKWDAGCFKSKAEAGRWADKNGFSRNSQVVARWIVEHEKKKKISTLQAK
jgi:hypothetical protein